MKLGKVFLEENKRKRLKIYKVEKSSSPVDTHT